MRNAYRLLVIGALLVGAAPVLAIIPAHSPAPVEQPIGARLTVAQPASGQAVAGLSADTGFAKPLATTKLPRFARQSDPVSVVLADPLITPLLALGAFLLAATVLLRRRRRRRLAWGYVPPEALRERIFSWLR